MRDIRAISLLIAIGTLSITIAQTDLFASDHTPSVLQDSSIPAENDTDDSTILQDVQPAAPRVRPARRVKTLLPIVDQKDIHTHHQEIADDTLRSIDSGCRNTLHNFYVRYDNPESRGLGGGSTMILSGNVPDDEFRALLIHECGHIIDTGSWSGNRTAGASNFKDGNQTIYADDPSVGFYSISWVSEEKQRKDARDEDFVSGYAAWNAFEDFAETFAFYTLHRQEFYERALHNDVLMRKYEFMEGHVASIMRSTSTYMVSTEIPWDITKLPYSWN